VARIVRSRWRRCQLVLRKLNFSSCDILLGMVVTVKDKRPAVSQRSRASVNTSPPEPNVLMRHPRSKVPLIHRLLSNLACAPTRILASTSRSQPALVWPGLIGLSIGAYYYYESYVVSSCSLILSQKAYETTIVEGLPRSTRNQQYVHVPAVCGRSA
jgi:hypothetical protein